MISFGILIAGLLGAGAGMALFSKARTSGTWDKAMDLAGDIAKHSKNKVHEKKSEPTEADDEGPQPL